VTEEASEKTIKIKGFQGRRHCIHGVVDNTRVHGTCFALTAGELSEYLFECTTMQQIQRRNLRALIAKPSTYLPNTTPKVGKRNHDVQLYVVTLYIKGERPNGSFFLQVPVKCSGP
jgi:hypothetical protein